MKWLLTMWMILCVSHSSWLRFSKWNTMISQRARENTEFFSSEAQRLNMRMHHNMDGKSTVILLDQNNEGNRNEKKSKRKRKNRVKSVCFVQFFSHLFSYFRLLLRTYRIIQLILRIIEENSIRKSDKQTNRELATRAKSSDTQHDTNTHTHIRQVSHGNANKTARTHSQPNNRSSNRK